MGLFLLAPLVGEFLLGNQPITELPKLPLYATMYGGGALLIREVARRLGRGWPTMIPLAAAYAILEEGPIDQMLWNPNYGGFDMGAAYAGTQVPVLGTSVALLQDVLSMHTVWSICVPIALVETFARRRDRPWLGGIGIGVTAVIFVLGSVMMGGFNYLAFHYMASAWQFGVAVVMIAALVAAALALPRPQPSNVDASTGVNPWLVGAVAFVASSVYWARDWLVPENAWAWLPVLGWCVLVAAVVALGMWTTRERYWGRGQTLGAAGGALLTYAWVGFTHSSQMGMSKGLALAGSTVFALAAVVLLAFAIRGVARLSPTDT